MTATPDRSYAGSPTMVWLVFKERILLPLQLATHSKQRKAIIHFYNGYEDASLDYRDYININASDWAEAVYTFGRGYNGEL